MFRGRVSRGISLSRRVFHMAPYLLAHPKHVLLGLKGVHIISLQMLDVPWIKESDIKTVIDVGASNGQFAGAIREVLPEAMIYSFEPLADCVNRIRESMGSDAKLRVFNNAVGDREGTAQFHRNAYSPSSSLLEMTSVHKDSYPWTKNSEVIDVQVRTLDSFLPELSLVPNILLKIDVQGFEDRVLLGANEILNLTNIVIVETGVGSSRLYDQEASFDDVYRLLSGRGFVFTGMLGQMLHPKSKLALQTDALFIRNTYLAR